MTSSNSRKPPKYKYKIILDIDKDAWNWYDGCNSTYSGVDWKQRIPENIYENIHGKSKKEALVFLIPFLKQKYIDEKNLIDACTNFINREYEQKFEKACQKVADLLNKPIYRDDFTIYLTTFPRGPYRYQQGSLWFMIEWIDPVKNFLHELLHFQFTHYWWKPDTEVGRLNDNDFHYLKESLTVILDEDFYPLIKSPDGGYEIHKEFRQELHKFWKTNKDFDKLVKFGLKILPKFVNNK